MTPRLVSLPTWAEMVYGPDAPHINTIRNWARDGKLYPPAEKHGRDYYVSPDTQYAGNEAAIERIKRQNERPKRVIQAFENPVTKIERLLRGGTGKKA